MHTVSIEARRASDPLYLGRYRYYILSNWLIICMVDANTAALQTILYNRIGNARAT